MNTTEEATFTDTASIKPAMRHKIVIKKITMMIRRGHLYLGLFLFPWAVLYGVTAFLFNHPTAFSDQPMVNFGPEALVDTPLDPLPDPQAIATQVLIKLNEKHQPRSPYRLAGPAKFGNRDFAFANMRTDHQTINILIDLKTGHGTIRCNPQRETRLEKAPFAVGSSSIGGNRGGRKAEGFSPGAGPTGRGAGLKLNDSLTERIQAAIPTILQRIGMPPGEATVTSLPDVIFPVEAEGRLWNAVYNPLTGSVNGTPADGPSQSELSIRRFLLRLHTTHGYPGETNSRWFWAVIVDAMACTMCFWGLSGLVMWWQIKATRRIGVILMLLSVVLASLLGFSMYVSMAN